MAGYYHTCLVIRLGLWYRLIAFLDILNIVHSCLVVVANKNSIKRSVFMKPETVPDNSA